MQENGGRIMKKIYAVLFALLIGIGASFYIYRMDLKAHSNLNELIEINDTMLRELLISETEDFFVYVGRPTCPFCNSYRPNLETAIRYNEEIRIYSFNTDDNREETYFSEVINRLGLTRIPFLIFIRNGQVLGMHGIEDGYSVEEIAIWIDETLLS